MKKKEKTPKKLETSCGVSYTDLDRWLIDSEKYYREIQFENRSICQTNPANIFSMDVSDRMLKRGLDLYAQFVIEIREAGYQFRLANNPGLYDSSSIVEKGDFHCHVRVLEKSLREYEGSYHQRKPTGILKFKIQNHYFEDKKGKPVEKQMKDIVKYIGSLYQEHLDIEKFRKEERKRKELRRQEEEERERLEREHQEAVRRRGNQAKEVISIVDKYVRAKHIRESCILLETLSREHGLLDGRMQEKIDVARKVADWIDPFCDYEDSILAELFKPGDFC